MVADRLLHVIAPNVDLFRPALKVMFIGHEDVPADAVDQHRADASWLLFNYLRHNVASTEG